LFIPTVYAAGRNVDELVDDLVSELAESREISGSGSTVIVAWRTNLDAIISGGEDPWPAEGARSTLSREASRDRVYSVVQKMWKKMCW
jgi:hypothetical protein